MRVRSSQKCESPLDGSRCYFGADDGWIRAVGLRDGAAAWSVRAAPAERRIVAFAGLASPWPVPGSVLVHGGRVYASAGRSSEADGGLAVLCLDAADGSQRWASGIAPGPRLLNDLLRWQDGELRLHDLRLDPLQGTDLNAAALAKVKRTGNLDGLVDPTWTRLGNRRSGLVRRGILAGDLVAWDASLAVSWNSAKPRGLAGHGIDVLADPPPAPEPPPGTKPTPPVVPSVWRLDLPPGTQVEALALGADGIAAVLRQARGDTATGVLLIVGRDGLERARIDLPAPGAVHGLALADGVILVALEDGTLTCWGG